MTPLVLALALVLQQQVPQQRAAAVRDSAQAATRQAIMDVGRGVAEVRTSHDMLRRAVFNSSDAQVVAKGQEMQRRCRELATIAQSAPRRLCPSCWSAIAQRAIDAYRGTGLQAVRQVGTRCASQLTQGLGSRNAAAALRANIHAVSRTVTEGLQPYEAKLLDVRRAFGLEPPAPPTAPGRRP